MKDFLSLDEQVAKLVANGLLPGTDQDRLLRVLRDQNYYRLSGYFRYFQLDPKNGKNAFRPDTTVDVILAPYNLDRRLTRTLWVGIMEFEVVFRSTMAYCLAEKYGPYGYLNPSIYLERTGSDGVPLRAKLIEDVRGDIRRSTERFVQHHKQRSSELPIWAAVEVLSLGTVSKMYGLLDEAVLRKSVAQRFAIKHNVSTATFRSMSILRNVCAHHSRIWNRTHGVVLEAPQAAQGWGSDAAIYKDTPWAWIVTLAHIVDAIRGNDSYSESIWKLVDTVSDDLLEGLTYPKDV